MNSSTPAQPLWRDSEWLKEAIAWIEAETKRAGLKVAAPIEQPSVGPWSTVMVVRTDEQALFFKATTDRHEAALTKTLAGWYGDRLPELVAVDVERGWLLMRDGGQPLRSIIRPAKDIAPWNSVLPLYLDLQLDATRHVDKLLSLGVPDRRLACLPDLFAQLLEDVGCLGVGQEPGLTAEEFQRLSEVAPRFAGICTDLAALGIPESVDHGDLHDGNVLLRDGRVAFLDWGDARVTHPIVSLRTLFVSIEISLQLDDYAFRAEMGALLRRYLKPWQRFASQAELVNAFALSQCVACVVSALSWHHTLSSLEESARQEYLDTVPELMREFMLYEAKLPR